MAAAVVSALPIAGCALSALNNAVDANHKIKKENLKGKAKAKVVDKTTGKVAIKYAAGIIGSYCTLQSINDTFDLS